MSGNANETEDARESPRKSSLFFLTVWQTLESHYAEIGCDGWESGTPHVSSGALSMALENSVA